MTKNKILDYVKVSGNKIEFPTLCCCLSCGGGGINGLFATANIRDKNLAYEIALVQHGYYLKMWEGQNIANKEIIPKMCSCECTHDWKTEALAMFEHKAICVKCGEIRCYDSSG